MSPGAAIAIAQARRPPTHLPLQVSIPGSSSPAGEERRPTPTPAAPPAFWTWPSAQIGEDDSNVRVSVSARRWPSRQLRTNLGENGRGHLHTAVRVWPLRASSVVAFAAGERRGKAPSLDSLVADCVSGQIKTDPVSAGVCVLVRQKQNRTAGAAVESFECLG